MCSSAISSKQYSSSPAAPMLHTLIVTCDMECIAVEASKPDGRPDRKRYGAMKLLQFHENYRPAYWGTWRKKSSHISPRCPLRQDKDLLDYEVDSDEEWEEEEPGESLSHSEGVSKYAEKKHPHVMGRMVYKCPLCWEENGDSNRPLNVLLRLVMVLRSRTITPIIEVNWFTLSYPHLVSCFPDLPRGVLLLLHCPPVGLLGLFKPNLEFSLHMLQMCRVSSFERRLLLVEEVLDITEQHPCRS
ncbi:hypothetical protein XENOCAPTIV_002269 [Xenoophorus captivus]|uniref:Chromatin assembly factor 1 subunit A dimerization domain-containing protein n=1 Tax=Xenoophorus captivus TaxID=1517983 RepID=A0ABV0RGY3_9TELE